MDFKTEIEKIRAYALSARSSIYNEDAMTAIELAGQTACKVNECVEAINGILSVVENIVVENGLKYDPNNEKIII